KITVGKRGRTAILAPDGRVLGVPHHVLIRSEDDIRARLLKMPREAGFLIHGAAFDQWVADGRPAEKTQFLQAEGDTWIGRFREFPLRNRQLVVATVVPRGDFVVWTAWDAAAIGAMMLAVLVLAYLLGQRFSSRFAGQVDALVAESERIGQM